MRVHCVGVAGNGMFSLAELAKAMGYDVSGSDMALKPILQHLQQRGITLYRTHAASNVMGAALVVRSIGVPLDNIEVLAATEQCIPVFTRCEGIAKLIRQREQSVIAVTGTYGKTTTTALVAAVLSSGGLDPTVYAGGYINALDGGACAGAGPYAVVEACEYKGEFFHFDPIAIVVTGLVLNHEDYFRNGIGDICRAFASYLDFHQQRTELVLACADSPSIRDALVPDRAARIITYGLHHGTWRAVEIRHASGGSSFKVLTGDRLVGTFQLMEPGEHLVQNAIAAIAVGVHLGVSTDRIQAGLHGYRGVKRRFEVVYRAGGLCIIDDNGRLPVQIAATIQAARSAFDQDRVYAVVGVWGRLNPRDLDAYATALSSADYAFILPVGNAAIEAGGTERNDAQTRLANKIQALGGRASPLTDAEELENEVRASLAMGKRVVVLMLGYDSFSTAFRKLMETLAAGAVPGGPR